MNFTPASHVLEELSGDDPAPRLEIVQRIADPSAPLRQPLGSRRRELTQADVDRAWEEGLEQGKAAAVAQYEVKLMEQRESWGSELRAARDRWEEAAGQELWAGLQEGLGAIRQELATVLVDALRPFLQLKLSEKAAQHLAQAVIEILSDAETEKVEVVGPEQLVEAFEQAAFGRAHVAATVDNSKCELSVRVGTSTLSTRIGEWLEKLEIES